MATSPEAHRPVSGSAWPETSVARSAVAVDPVQPEPDRCDGAAGDDAAPGGAPSDERGVWPHEDTAGCPATAADGD